MIRIGRYTAALSLTALGVLLLLDHGGYVDALSVLKIWWPAAIVALGIEVIAVQAFNKPQGTKVRVAFGSIIGAVVLGALVLAATRGSEIQDSFLGKWANVVNWKFTDSGEAKFAIDKDAVSIPLSGADKRVTISNTNGHVILTQGPVSNIEVKTKVFVDVADRAKAEEIARQSTVKVVQGDRIQIEADGKAYGTANLRKPRMDLTIVFPQGRTPPTEINIDNGSVRIDNLIDSTEFILDVKNGEITGQNIGGIISAKLLNGDIHLSNLKGATTVETANGNILVQDALGAVTAQTAHGNIIIRSLAVGGDWKASSALGDVELAWPDGANVDVSVNSEIGDVSSEWPLELSNHKAKGKLGNGQWKIAADTISDISLLKIER